MEEYGYVTRLPDNEKPGLLQVSDEFGRFTSEQVLFSYEDGQAISIVDGKVTFVELPTKQDIRLPIEPPMLNEWLVFRRTLDDKHRMKACPWGYRATWQNKQQDLPPAQHEMLFPMSYLPITP